MRNLLLALLPHILSRARTHHFVVIPNTRTTSNHPNQRIRILALKRPLLRLRQHHTAPDHLPDRNRPVQEDIPTALLVHIHRAKDPPGLLGGFRAEHRGLQSLPDPASRRGSLRDVAGLSHGGPVAAWREAVDRQVDQRHVGRDLDHARETTDLIRHGIRVRFQDADGGACLCSAG